MSILVFPSCVDAAKLFAVEAKIWDKRVVGASSLEYDESKSVYDAWEYLPFISEPGFVSALKAVINDHCITQIFTPHLSCFMYFSRILSQYFPKVKLRGQSPSLIQMTRVTKAIAHGQSALSAVNGLYGGNVQIESDFLSSLLAQTLPLYGECSRDKILGIVAAMCHAPSGDVVEIGSFFGKSAYILNRLAGYYNIGPTIAVDPWDKAISVQYDSPKTIQMLSGVWDWEQVFNGFLLTLQANFIPPFNYIRATSEKAWEIYRKKQSIESPQFGSSRLSGRIALLHIDGNHDEAEVRRDFMMWSQKLAEGGWVVFDDYGWSFGSGPRKVADQILFDWSERIERHFIAGGALFLKTKG